MQMTASEKDIMIRMHQKRLLSLDILKLLLLLCIALAFISCTTNRKIIYQQDDTDFINPERGFYIPIGTKSSHFIPLDSSQLRNLRENPQQPGKASYKVRVSLIYRGYELDTFKDKPLSAEFLNLLQKDFDVVRADGLKMIIRFAYTNSATSGNCKDEYKICPPYGDAPPKIIFRHIEQLEPFLKKNEDVIAVLQEGFIGIWGENYFTDYFGDASMNGIGKIADTSWQLRSELLKRLLIALPKDRMIQVRTPQIKQKFIFGAGASVNSSPLKLPDAFSEEDKARIGFHNDCFLSSADDYGTYYNYGSSTQPRQPANEILRKYIEEDTRFTAVGGETCDDAFSPQNDCEPAGHAETEMKSMHYSFLNATYNTDVNNDWDSTGCMVSIKNKLGYRFVLEDARFPKKISIHRPFKIFLHINNIGYASPYNPRPLRLVLRNLDSRSEEIITLKTDVRFIFSGRHDINEKIQLNKNIPAGKYALYLSIPDANLLLSKRPEYSLRLANLNTWEDKTGFNNLQDSVIIR
jgi:Domain of unknown function (DUF4832)/Domain of unknown function (DUF4874)